MCGHFPFRWALFRYCPLVNDVGTSHQVDTSPTRLRYLNSENKDENKKNDNIGELILN